MSQAISSWLLLHPAGANQHLDLVVAIVLEREALPAIGILRDLRSGSSSPPRSTRGQHDRIARPAERAIPHQLVAIKHISARIGVGLGDSQTRRLAVLDRRKTDHHDLRRIGHRLAGVEPALLQLGAADRLDLQRVAGIEPHCRRIRHACCRRERR